MTIGVFDSGIGGLTVLKAMQQRLPNESFIYLGDTARLPYGIKSPETVTKYALQAAEILVKEKIKLLVVACNTASSVALPALKEAFYPIPVIGVIDPGAQAAVEASHNKHIAVIATEGTIANKAYDHAILKLCPDAKITSTSCGLFVPLAEEGWLEGTITDAITARYLNPLFQDKNNKPDCLVLGCTHFPVLQNSIRYIIGSDIAIVDSAQTTANAVARELDIHNLQQLSPQQGCHRYLTTDAPERFKRVAKHLLNITLPNNEVELVSL